jgi:hypothetical protein
VRREVECEVWIEKEVAFEQLEKSAGGGGSL